MCFFFNSIAFKILECFSGIFEMLLWLSAVFSISFPAVKRFQKFCQKREKRDKHFCRLIGVLFISSAVNLFDWIYHLNWWSFRRWIDSDGGIADDDREEGRRTEETDGIESNARRSPDVRLPSQDEQTAGLSPRDCRQPGTQTRARNR